MIHRYQALAETRGVTDGLETDWAGFAGRALNAATLTNLLSRHDKQTADAAAQGSAAHYQQALDLLDESDAMIEQARGLRDDLAGSTDVSTLTTWIDRNAAYDAAVRRLYDALLESKGRVTDQVREAFAGEQAARRGLPADTRGLVVIMSDIAQGGLNQAVISIEQARGALSSALDLQHQLQHAARAAWPRRGPEPRRRVRRRYTARKFPASSGLPGAQQAVDGHPGGPSCRSALSPTSRGRSRRTSSWSPSSASSSSRAPTTSSTVDPAASCARSRRSASCATVATGRRSARPVSSRRGGCWSSRPATPRTSTARPCASSPPARSGA